MKYRSQETTSFFLMQHKGLTLQWTFWKMFFWSWSYPPLDFGRLLESYLTFNMFAELVFPRELKCWLLLSSVSAAAGGLMCPVTHSHPIQLRRPVENCKYFQLFPRQWRVSPGLSRVQVDKPVPSPGCQGGEEGGELPKFMALETVSSTPSSVPHSLRPKRGNKKWEGLGGEWRNYKLLFYQKLSVGTWLDHCSPFQFLIMNNASVYAVSAANIWPIFADLGENKFFFGTAGALIVITVGVSPIHTDFLLILQQSIPAVL